MEYANVDAARPVEDSSVYNENPPELEVEDKLRKLDDTQKTGLSDEQEQASEA